MAVLTPIGKDSLFHCISIIVSSRRDEEASILSINSAPASISPRAELIDIVL
jgi:hypothetical protein